MEALEFNRNDSRVARIVSAAYPEYKGRRSIKVSACLTYYVSDYWSEGSRSYCCVLSLAGDCLCRVRLEDVGFVKQVNGNWLNLPLGELTMRPDFIVVENVIFSGKDLGVRIYCHPETIKMFG